MTSRKTTREGIEKAAKQAGFYAFSDMEVVDFALEMVRRHNEELVKEIPSSWLDELLSGPLKIVKMSPPQEIERLLNAIRLRLKSAKP